MRTTRRPRLITVFAVALLVASAVFVGGSPAQAASASFTVEQCFPATSSSLPDPYTVVFRTTVTGLEPLTPVESRITFAGHTLSSNFGSGLGTVANSTETYTVAGTAIGSTATTIVFVNGVQLQTISIVVSSDLCAAAEPETTADCKNEGFLEYGGFKNQGDCVRFVKTKGKNQPAE